VIRTVAQNTQLTVLGQDASTAWLSVRLPDGTQAWIARALTDFTGSAAIVAAPALAQPPLAPPATAPAAADTTGAFDANVRTGPSTLYPVIRAVPNGTQFTLLGQDASGAWLAVRFADGTEGWIARFLTDVTSTVTIVDTPTLAQPPLAPPSTIATDAVFVTGALNVNVRSGPSTAYSVIRTVMNGTLLTVLGQEATGAWLSVRLSDGTQGWIARSLTNFTGAATIIAVPALTQPPLAPPASVNTAIVTAPTNASPPAGSIASLPSQAAAVDNFPIAESLGSNWRVLRSGETQWFTFSHPGDQAPVQIWMDVEPGDAAGFRIYSEADAQAIMAGANPDDFVDIGRGTPNPNEPADLFWRGAFDEHGRYFVMVDGGATGDAGFSIYGVGPSIGG
jgi:uncharacterized protein YgiM (DUF1202 family)